jgi:hypothetical protein
MPTFRRRFELNFASAIDNNDIFGDGVFVSNGDGPGGFSVTGVTGSRGTSAALPFCEAGRRPLRSMSVLPSKRDLVRGQDHGSKVPLDTAEGFIVEKLPASCAARRAEHDERRGE